MIGKSEWFNRRKYSGWGLGTPRNWKGWVYLAGIFIPFLIFQLLPFWNNLTKIIVTAAWLIFLVFDVTSMMIKMGDERERKHEAIAERNALWIVIAVLVAGLGYQIAQSAVNQNFKIDIFIIIALFAGIIAKAISNIYLDKKD